jgi:hypothetical protein
MHWGKVLAYFVVFIIFGILSPIYGVTILRWDKTCVQNILGECEVDDKGREILESHVFAGVLYWTFGALSWGWLAAKWHSLEAAEAADRAAKWKSLIEAERVARVEAEAVEAESGY